jgi:trans-aconitate methyltransferase
MQPVPTTSGETLIEWLLPRKGERILDAGCGIGSYTSHLARDGAMVSGLDLIEPLLEQARISAPGCTFYAGDVLTWQAPAPFDAVYAHALLNWVRPPDKAAKAVMRLLAPGGRLAAFLGSASEVARQLDAYYNPSPSDYQKVLRKAGFTMERW